MGWEASMNLAQHSMDDIQNGTEYGRVKLADLTNGRIDIDKVQEGVTNKFLLATERAKLASIEEGAQVNEVTGSNILAKINASGEATKIAEAQLQGLSASKITSGTFDLARIPTITTSKINIDASLDFHQNKALNFVPESGTEFPSNPVDGQIFNKGGILYIYKV